MSGYVDLHLHYLPAVDDGVRTREDAARLLTGLRDLGFARAIATPHIRPGLFPNRPSALADSFRAFAAGVRDDERFPALGLGAEHWVDETFRANVEADDLLPYPGAKAILVELPPTAIPLGFESVCFRLRTKRLLPVLAHPERYTALADRTDPIDPFLDQGGATLLDLMSLVGRYGRAAQRAAERMLDEGVYDAACSDSHGPKDLDEVARGLDALLRRVGRRERDRLLVSGPTSILAGKIEP